MLTLFDKFTRRIWHQTKQWPLTSWLSVVEEVLRSFSAVKVLIPHHKNTHWKRYWKYNQENVRLKVVNAVKCPLGLFCTISSDDCDSCIHVKRDFTVVVGWAHFQLFLFDCNWWLFLLCWFFSPLVDRFCAKKWNSWNHEMFHMKKWTKWF